MDSLPPEIILQISRYLEPLDIVTLQHVNRKLLLLARDDTLWREQCFKDSSFLGNLRRRRELLNSEGSQEPHIRELARALASGNGLEDSRLARNDNDERLDMKARANEKIRIMANWDPSYPDEAVRWYDEYIARNAPISTSWLQQPRSLDPLEGGYLEVRGFALYTPSGLRTSTLVVGPLDDGSICIWDIGRNAVRRGAIVARSQRGLLSVDDNAQIITNKRSKMLNTAVTECVSVDSNLKRAYFAIQSGLIEVDLETLTKIGHDRYPYSITTLSLAHHPTPLTVGTNLQIYLHDAREKLSLASDRNERLEAISQSFGISQNRTSTSSFRDLLNPDASPVYTHLHQPGPLSILHLPSSGSEWDGNGEIYVAGRFPSILNYDRRYFPKLRGTIYSGARLAAMTWLPHPFSAVDTDLARRGELSTDQVYEAKTRPGKTLIACGEYNSKGSLELYGLSANPLLSNISSSSSAGTVHNAVMKNRQTSSASKLLAVSNHGTRIVVSDGNGNLKWLERDGFTEARRWNISFGSVEAPRGIFGTLGDSFMDSGSGDIILKLANTRRDSESAINEDDLLVWTGEKIGLLGFSREPGFTADGFEPSGTKTPDQVRLEQQEDTYSQTMRRALEANADEVRYMRGLGLGFEE